MFKLNIFNSSHNLMWIASRSFVILLSQFLLISHYLPDCKELSTTLCVDTQRSYHHFSCWHINWSLSWGTSAFCPHLESRLHRPNDPGCSPWFARQGIYTGSAKHHFYPKLQVLPHLAPDRIPLSLSALPSLSDPSSFGVSGFQMIFLSNTLAWYYHQLL